MSTPVVAKRGGGEEPDIADVKLARPEAVDFARLTRHVFTASSCGLCGKATIAAVQGRSRALGPDEGPRVTATILAKTPAVLVGFLRDGRMNIYAAADRVVG